MATVYRNYSCFWGILEYVPCIPQVHVDAHVIPHGFSLALLLPLGCRWNAARSCGVTANRQQFSRDFPNPIVVANGKAYSKMDESCGRVSILKTESLYDRFNKLISFLSSMSMKLMTCTTFVTLFVEICERKSKFCVIGLATSKIGAE